MRAKVSLLVVIVVLTGAAVTRSIQAQGSVAPPADGPTFSNDVAPILFKHCASCHRPGEAAPMSLLTYEQARPWAKAIGTAINNRTMPPWHADAPAGTFHNERILSDAERQTLNAWASGGALRGDPGDLPPMPVFTEGWSLGTPDLVLEMGEERQIPATGTIEYEYFYIPANFTDAKWVTSIEVRPGNRAAVHHVLVRYRTPPTPGSVPLARGNPKHSVLPKTPPGERPVRSDVAKMTPRLVATYAPGTNAQTAPAGTAFRFEPGGVFELQMHYTATGKPGSDRTTLGITFSREAAPREVRALQFLNATLVLPAGAPDVSVTTDFEFLQDATVWGVFPHTHVRGKKWEYQLQLPSGEVRPVLSVPRYDFNWQTYYMFREPLQVSKGAKLISTAWYDNSVANKSNPDPTKDVTWGDQTWEEMQYTGVLVSAR